MHLAIYILSKTGVIYIILRQIILLQKYLIKCKNLCPYEYKDLS